MTVKQMEIKATILARIKGTSYEGELIDLIIAEEFAEEEAKEQALKGYHEIKAEDFRGY